LMSLSPDGLDWREYFRRMRQAQASAEGVAEEADDVLEVIEAARPARPSDLNASVAGILASLAVCGFWSACQVTKVFLEGKEYKTGERAGERRPDKELTNFFVAAACDDRRWVKAWWQEGKLVSATVGVAGEGGRRVVSRMGDLQAFIEGGGDS
jgi:hypothetical protein